MKKINLLISELVCQAVAIVLLYIPGMFLWEHWEMVSLGRYQQKLSMSITFFHAVRNTYDLLGHIVAGIMYLNFALLLLHLFFNVPKKLKVIDRILPLISIALMIIFAYLAGIKDSYGYVAPVNWLFYIDMFFLVATAITANMKPSQQAAELSKEEINVVNMPAYNSDTDPIEELKRFKELLDCGIITQEEFDAKKKQLLGM